MEILRGLALPGYGNKSPTEVERHNGQSKKAEQAVQVYSQNLPVKSRNTCADKITGQGGRKGNNHPGPYFLTEMFSPDRQTVHNQSGGNEKHAVKHCFLPRIKSSVFFTNLAEKLI